MMVFTNHRLAVIILQISLIGIRYTVSLSSFETRLSRLRPWYRTNDSSDEQTKQQVDLGWCLERRRRKDEATSSKQKEEEGEDGKEQDIMYVTVGWGNSERSSRRSLDKLQEEEDEEEDDDDNKQQGYKSITFKLPDLRHGSLGTSLWPSSIASSILFRSPKFQSLVVGKEKKNEKKKILELGCGLGLSGLVAAAAIIEEDSSSSSSDGGGGGGIVTLTDNDEEVMNLFETRIFPLNQDALLLNNNNDNKKDSSSSRLQLQAQHLDWRDIHEEKNVDPVDIVIGSDVAYYYYLLRPLMDTIRAYLPSITTTTAPTTTTNVNEDDKYDDNDNDKVSSLLNSQLLIIVGQATRDSQWDLYNNIQNGCYNQLTDEHEASWSGTTQTLLYNLEMSQWIEEEEEEQNFDKIFDNKIDGVLPMSVIIHSNNNKKDIQHNNFFSDFDHIATKEDEDSIMTSF